MLYHPLRFSPDHSVLLETDICGDVDDVGALALLLAETRHFGFGLAGININCPTPDSAAAVTAILRSRGFSGIPVGRAEPQKDLGSNYLSAVATLLPDTEPPTTTMPSEQLYRQILESVPDHSLTIISIGFLQTLDQAWRTTPELFERKVASVIIMGGSFLYQPGYREFNLVRVHQSKAEDFINHYPGTLFFVGFELGCDIYTDLSPEAENLTDPVVAAYRAYSAKTNGGVPNYRRCSWDPITVDFAVHGEGARYRLSPNIELEVIDGVCRFRENPAANRAFVIPTQDNDTIGQYLSRQILADIPK